MEQPLSGALLVVMAERKRALIDTFIKCLARSDTCLYYLQLIGQSWSHSLTQLEGSGGSLPPEGEEYCSIWQTSLMITTWDFFFFQVLES